MERIFIIFITIYGILALLHIILQIIFGHLSYRRQMSEKFQMDNTAKQDKFVTVSVPAYNEEPEILKACIDSIVAQNVQLEVIVVDDCSTNIDELNEKVYSQYENEPRVKIIKCDENRGKRHVQREAFDIAKGEFIVTVDSDTILHDENAIEKLISYFKTENIGAVTGFVAVENMKQNFLTRLIGYRYWSAFYQERAAQSFWWNIMCCSGPFSAYRKSIIEQIKDDYTSQMFLGEKCTYGDDRHLTNLVLAAGWKVSFNQTAEAHTIVPETLGKYVKQQVRWNKSFYREMLWTLKFVTQKPWYIGYELLMDFILPFLLTISLFVMLGETIINHHWSFLISYVIVLVLVALVRSAYGIYRTRDFGFASFAVYGFMHVLILLPVRFYALCTMKSTKWGTR